MDGDTATLVEAEAEAEGTLVEAEAEAEAEGTLVEAEAEAEGQKNPSTNEKNASAYGSFLVLVPVQSHSIAVSNSSQNE